MGIRAVIMGLLGVGVSAFALWRPFAGLIFVVFLYFWRPALWGGEAYITPVEWVTVATALGWLIQERRKGIIAGAGWLLAFGVAYVLSTLLSPLADAESWAGVQKIAKILFFSFLIVRLCDTPRRLSICAATVLLGCLWMIKAVLVSWAAQGFSGAVRIDTAVGQGGGANYTAWVLACTLPLLVYKMTAGRSWERWASLALIPIWLAAIIATGSRGGFLCTAVSLGVTLLMLRKGTPVVVITAAALFLVPLVPDQYWARINTITLDADEMDTSALARYQNWSVATQIVRDYPIFGTGLDTFPRVKQRYTGPDYVGGNLVTHNTYLQMASELGVPFLVMFFVFNAWLLWRLLQLRPAALQTGDGDLAWLRAWLLAALVATALQMAKGDMAGLDYFWWQYAVGLAVLRACGRAQPSMATTPAGASVEGGDWTRAAVPSVASGERE